MKMLKEFIKKLNPITSAFIALSMYLPKMWISDYVDDPRMIVTVAAYCVIGFVYGVVMYWAHGEDK